MNKDEELMLTLKRVIGQRLIGVTKHKKEWQLHFPDFVVFVEKPFPSPIMERMKIE